VIKWSVKLHARFFTFFAKSPKHDFLRIFGVVAHVFSNTDQNYCDKKSASFQDHVPFQHFSGPVFFYFIFQNSSGSVGTLSSGVQMLTTLTM